MESHATVATDRAERYMKQLASHLGTRLSVQRLDDAHLTISMDETTSSTLEATPSGIEMRVEALSGEDMARLQDVLARHLLRFIGGDQAVVWTDSP